jgi:hypothetical protein
MKPAVSMRAPLPMTMPLGLIRYTRPFDCNCPSSSEGVAPVTRLSTAEAAPDWTKRVVSPAAIENPPQLMMLRSLLVMVSSLPCWAMATWPATTCGLVGLAPAGAAQQAARARARARVLRCKDFMRAS